jgi:hypothetical protein
VERVFLTLDFIDVTQGAKTPVSVFMENVLVNLPGGFLLGSAASYTARPRMLLYFVYSDICCAVAILNPSAQVVVGVPHQAVVRCHRAGKGNHGEGQSSEERGEDGCECGFHPKTIESRADEVLRKQEVLGRQLGISFSVGLQCALDTPSA